MRTLRRFWPLLLLALLVAIGALAHAPGRTGAASGRLPSSPAGESTASAVGARPRAALNVSRRSVSVAARAFALSYLRYLNRRTTVAALAPASADVRRTAFLAGPVPVGARAAELKLNGLRAVSDSTTSSARETLVASDRAHTFYAQLTLSPAPAGWIVTGLVPPDYPTVLGTGRPSTPIAPSAARTAAQAFMDTYVPWTYGELATTQIRAVSNELRTNLAANRPRVPATIRRLHPSIGPPTLEWGQGADAWRGWAAVTTVTDGLETYLVSAQLEQIAGRWETVKMLPRG